ncbi:MAG: aspartate--tRNA(Asn) ligase [Anaeroplasmataceae bacterium]|nr:aspartate--tRNA(Asn) ligase [Anaeroplasmataceae bacterium]MDE6414675.1 aspartate--tRNA(Asn) ligase [Anaeroplasmataceae bacterium]
MKRVMLKDIKLGQVNKIAGFVENIRNKKAMCFIVLRDVSGKLQLTIEKEKHPELVDILDQITVDSVIEATGPILESEYVKLNHMEMYPDSIKLESIAAPSPIVAPKGEETNIDLRLDYRWIDLRTDKNTLMFKVQSYFIAKCREFLVDRDFIEIHSPKLIGAESESGAGVFKVEYFDRDAFLAQSPQFYKQMAMAAGFERIFESGPVFRAEKFASRKHATEFTGFDLEFSYIESFEDVMKMEEEMLTFALAAVHEKYATQIKEVYDIDLVVPTLPFPRMDLHDVYNELEARYGYKVPESEKGDLTTEGERMCQKLSMDNFGHEFLFITGYAKENRAFYHMRDEHGVPCGYDLIWKGCEITTGAQREHRYEILKKQAEEKGLDKDVQFYLDFFKYGCPPHGGFGIGVDRITMLLFNQGIKDAMFIFRGPDRLNP